MGNADGLQATGFANIAMGKMDGIQAAGFTNIAKEGIEGIQASGFFNYAKSLKGMQIGFLNVTDSIEEGFMIGFLSFAINGYHKWQLESNEVSQLDLAFKTGTNTFYNIISAGATVKDESLYWNFGYGIGSQIYFNKSAGLNIDLSFHQINKDEFTADLNMLTKLKQSFFYQFHKHLTVYGGPSLNLLVSEANLFGESAQLEGLINDGFYSKSISEGDYNLKGFFGFHGGIRF